MSKDTFNEANYEQAIIELFRDQLDMNISTVPTLSVIIPSHYSSTDYSSRYWLSILLCLLWLFKKP